MVRPLTFPGSQSRLRELRSRAEAAVAAATALNSGLENHLDRHASASLVVSGGSTPGPCLRLLSATTLDWGRVCVIPSDERWVDTGHADSNEAMIRRELLQDNASPARLLPLYRPGATVEEACSAIRDDLADLSTPLCRVLLGMGEDGHFASLFPDFAGLEQALDTDGKATCVAVQTTASPHTRISLTLSTLVNSAGIVLLFYGAKKREVFEAAASGNSSFPVHALIHQQIAPVMAIWAP